ncbi:Pre-mRNA-splicing factor SLU7 [Lonchura striata]|uniref:Pre-mRNA-splicing factor SLU7 n=1 Tax=Lonchura striata TaxID=40157 RepID=A0A218UNA6_9PASE|nr:Pre-mRNA-splicing factor SLU7 [Lonchura striata domestica]
MTREDWRKKKELEKQRKLGNAPAEVDEEGKDINPHIPQCISSVPWYIDPSERPTLKHQRAQPEKQKRCSSSGDWYKRGVQEHAVATRYRKGAYELVQPQLMFDYDGKRDWWNGYDPEEHMKIVEEYSKVDLAKCALKAQKLQEELASGKLEQANSPRHQWGEEESNSQAERDDSSEDEDDVDMPGQNFGSKRRITVQNLHIWEDIAKYLRNLDPSSAYYDPKTRAMRENPYTNTGKNPGEVGYAGDNFVCYTGDAISMAQTQLLAWEAYDKGSEVHLQADPTKLELLYQSFKAKKKKKDFKAQQNESIPEKYGGQEHLDAPPAELLLAQTEDYVEHSRHGTVIKGQQKALACSEYEEDVKINNHSCIWGSYWKGKWGCKCCHSFVKYSYCTGEAGKEIADTEAILMEEQPEEEEHMTKPKTLMEIHQEKQKETKK